MTWAWALTALAAIAGTAPAPAADAPQTAKDVSPVWQIAMRVSSPMTSTDPEHIAAGLEVLRAGRYRTSLRYQPSESDPLGLIHASMGFRLLRRQNTDVAFDLDFTQVWADRRLFRGTGWQLEGHDRRRLSLGTLTFLSRERRYLGIVDSVELGAGRMYIRRLVSARAGSTLLSPSPDPILVSSGPVGVIGLGLARPLFWGLTGAAHVRVVGAGRSRGGEVPFAHVTAEWDVSRRIFRSGTRGQGFLGVTGNHASSARAASYFQNGLGLAFRIAY